MNSKILGKKKELNYLYEIIYRDDRLGTNEFFSKVEGLEKWEADQHCVRSMTFKGTKKKEEDDGVVVPPLASDVLSNYI